MATVAKPETLDELIGQENLRQKARIAIGAALQRGEPLPHVLLTSSGGGLGKTTLARILANEMYAPLASTSGQCFTTALDLRNILIRLKPGSLVLIDEFHGIGGVAAEELLLVLEEGVLNINLGGNGVPVRLPVPPFTLVAATTCPSAISGPLRQRMPLHFHFGFYSVGELCEIVKSMADRLGMTFAPEVRDGIARRALGVPRIALRLTERVRDVAHPPLCVCLRGPQLSDADSVGLSHLACPPCQRHRK